MLIYSKANQRGFSLLELLVVLTIISLTATLVSWGIKDRLQGLNLHATANKIAASLRLASSKAKEDGILVTVYFRENGFTNLRTGSLSNYGQRIIPAPQSSAYIRFHPSGFTEGGTIILQNGDELAQISVQYFTGQIHVQ